MFTNVNRPSAVDVLRPFVVGDIFTADTTSTLAKVADVAVGNVLLSGGVGVIPAWGKVTLSSHVSGVLPAVNGGTGVANTGTITTAANISFTGAGSFITGGFTLTIPATGTAGLLGTIQTWSAANTFSAITTVSNTTNASNATTGALVVGNGTSATSVAIGGGNVYAGGAANRFASGNVAASGTTLQVTKGSLATSGNDWGILASTTVAPGGASTQNASGIAGNVSIASGASGISGGLTGLDGAIDADASANTFALTTALRGTMRKGGACTITMATAVEAAFSSTAAGTVGTAHGFYMSSMANSGGATITTAYGLRIETVTIGATNYAIYTNSGLVRFGDEVLTTASTTTRAGLNVPHGSAPSSPVNGDMWTTTAGLFVRINGATVGPLS